MAKQEKEKSRPAPQPPKSAKPSNAPAAQVPKGMRDVSAHEQRGLEQMLGKIRAVYESYGFEPIDTPLFEYTDALGKFLPDQDRPNEGVFSFQDEDGRWLSLRYDLTAPLARYTAEHYERLPKPFRRYASGYVFRNEKVGPGRFRQFMQFDADTVGTESMAADAEICMLVCDTLESLGLKGNYVVKVSNRKLLDGLLEAIGLGGEENAKRRLVVLRALDKFDRLGWPGVADLLGKGRKDESGDFTKGADLTEDQIAVVRSFLKPLDGTDRLAEQQTYQQGLKELQEIRAICGVAGYAEDRVRIDRTVVRGLEYYTGPVFEAELTFESKNEEGQTVRFGSVGGGGRYDDLVARFTGQRVPATGFSIGVSRLQAALTHLNKLSSDTLHGPVVVLVMEKDKLAAYQKLTQTLRQAGIRAEMYLGGAGMKAQMKYADKRGAPCVVIQGGDERAKGEVTIKDLIEGAKAAGAIKGHDEWREARPAQVSVPEGKLVDTVREILARHSLPS